jgi:hypothetical protein
MPVSILGFQQIVKIYRLDRVPEDIEEPLVQVVAYLVLFDSHALR